MLLQIIGTTRNNGSWARPKNVPICYQLWRADLLGLFDMSGICRWYFSMIADLDM